MPQFVNSSQGHIAWQIATLGLIFVAMTILWLTLVTLLTSSFEEWLVAHSGWSKSQRWFTGSVFIGLGIRIALPERK